MELLRKNSPPVSSSGEAGRASAEVINKKTLRDRLREYKRSPLSALLHLLVILAAAVTAAALLFVIVYIPVNGIPNLKPGLFFLNLCSAGRTHLPPLK